MKILVAVDGSRYTKRMLAYLAAHDDWLGVHHDYTVLHVVPAVPSMAAVQLDKGELKTYYEAAAEDVFKPVRTFFARHALKARWQSKVGHAGPVVAELAAKGGYDLVILGSHGHGAVASMIMGSVSSKVLAQCRTPVLLVR